MTGNSNNASAHYYRHWFYSLCMRYGVEIIDIFMTWEPNQSTIISRPTRRFRDAVNIAMWRPHVWYGYDATSVRLAAILRWRLQRLWASSSHTPASVTKHYTCNVVVARGVLEWSLLFPFPLEAFPFPVQYLIPIPIFSRHLYSHSLPCPFQSSAITIFRVVASREMSIECYAFKIKITKLANYIRSIINHHSLTLLFITIYH